MAPALSEAGRDTYHGQREPGKLPQMEEHGGPENLLKDSQEMERILGELGGAAEVDLLRVIETMEGAAGGLADPLASFDRDFLNDDEGGSLCADESAKERIGQAQARLERRCEFLRRRLRIQQARAAGKHIAEETRSVLGHAAGAPGRGAARALVQRLEVGGGAGGAPRWTSLPGLSAAAGALRTQLAVVGERLDSDATLSSSGAESADETVSYNNQLQQALPLRKRALWKWSHERAWIASRWGWLQAQVHELEHRIRQHAELQRQARAAKGPPLEPQPPSGYTGPLPGHDTETDAGEQCARVRPLNRATFRKRKLLQMHNLHTAADKAARPSDIRCICQWPLAGCAVCTGRAMPMHPLPPNSTLSKRERIALVDPGFHTVLSTVKDVSSSIHYSAIMKDPQWQQKSSRGSLKSLKSISAKMQSLPNNPPNNKVISTVPKLVQHKKRKYNRLKRGRGTGEVGRRRISLQEAPEGADLPSGGSSPVPSPSDHHRYRIRERDRTRLNSSYDIDNIVIPHSIAANTKLEILQYKEILTPKWRLIEDEPPTPNNGIVRKHSLSLMEEHESDTEDLSEAGVLERHERCEALERGKYLKKRKNSRRQNSRTTPTQTPPHSMVVDETSMSSEPGTTQPVTSTTVVCSNSTAVTNCSSAVNSVPPSVAMTACSVTLTQLTVPTSTATSTQDSCNSLQPNTTVNSISSKRRATEDSIEIVPPYSPRVFPLLDDVYTKMLKAMPDNHPLTVSEAVPKNHVNSNRASDSESSSMYKNCYPSSVLKVEAPSESDDESNSIPAEEDPTDPEWNVTAHTDKLHHR